ncbi:MAG: YwaF family protein, partial [Clostridia bacterium]
MFSKMGKYKACGIFSQGHCVLIAITISSIILTLKHTMSKSKEDVCKIITRLTIIMCILEAIKVIYSISQNSLYNVNTYLPLYYCSISLYAGLLSSFGKGKLKRVGDVFLATGSIIGGAIFIIYPSTSLVYYPAFHFFSIHSFLFHGIMVYLGILVNKTKYIELKKDDIKYFASLVGVMC